MRKRTFTATHDRVIRLLLRCAELILTLPGLLLGFGYGVWGTIFISEGVWLGWIGILLGPLMALGAVLLIAFAALGRFPHWAQRRRRTPRRADAS